MQPSTSSLHKGISTFVPGQQNLLAQDISLPAAVLYQSRIDNNLAWMQGYANQTQVKLAPHGKTTMAPGLFQQQMAAGAWAITLASAPQVQVAYHHGIKRVILANELVGKSNMQMIADLLQDPDFEFYCLTDSAQHAKLLADFFGHVKTPLKVLLEIGVSGGRCGCRTPEQIQQTLDVIHTSEYLQLAGVEFYEGVIHGDNEVTLIKQFVAHMIEQTLTLLAAKAFDTSRVLLTGAGSAWYDLVAESFQQARLPSQIIPVIRPGCYLIHDTGIYQSSQQALKQRSQVACDIKGDLSSALEVWAYVQSIPEPGHAIIGMGKRDTAFDAGLPSPELLVKPGDGIDNVVTLDSQWQLTDIMDQHAYLSFPEGAALKVGDMIAFSTSHPCLTFDKWKQLAVIDDEYQVIDMMRTYF
ncbi:amino acid deaminase [Motilimonas pumila]|uniref:Amino acid deaminase n=1 Tax=Motilimonas pumila TaxID=2303987 RepID=A0A418YF61_9GAMM|nr:amino acid deaminase [Motilimonas pumila]RJG47895.1 amino acid deaminase [Motilimonas pumila]